MANIDKGLERTKNVPEVITWEWVDYLFPKSPLDEREMLEIIETSNMFLEELRIKNKNVYKQFLKDPAAKSHHQNYEGGLVEHCFKFAVWLQVRNLRKDYPLGLSPRWIVDVAFLHDLCKVGLYKPAAQGYSYDPEEYKHHALESLRRARILSFELIRSQEICILLHMAGGWWNKEDEVGLDDEDGEWIAQNRAVLAAVQWADMKACE